MENVGFCVFGNPVRHDYKSNGLLKRWGIGDQTYLALPGKGELRSGDNLTIVSRENKGENEIIKIFSYEYAVSFRNSSNGYVGSGIAYSGKPTPKLLYSAYKKVHFEALKLVNINKNFKEEHLNESAIKLIEPATEGLVSAKPLPKNNNIKTGSSLGVRIDGPIQNHLMSVVQGFMFNPNFKSIEKLYVSSNQQLLVDCLGTDKIYSIQHLLDFSDHFKNLYESIGKLKKEREEILHQIKTLQADANEKNSSLIGLNAQISEREDKKIELERLLFSLQNDLVNIKGDRDKVKEELNQFNKLKINKFRELLSLQQFQNERHNYEKGFKDSIKNLETKNIRLEQELESYNNRLLLNKKMAVYIGVFSLLLAIGSGYLGYLLNQPQISSLELINNDGVSPKDNEINGIPRKASLSAPNEYTLSDFLKLNAQEIEGHKARLDAFIEEVEKADSNRTNLSNFFDRKWNFAEVIDSSDKTMEDGLARLKRIKSIYSNHKKSVGFFDKKFMIEDFESFTLKEHEFKSSSRNEILYTYLGLRGNVYETILSQPSKPVDFEKEHPLLYMHFRWMVYMNSAYEENGEKKKDADILKTNKTKHNVPLKK